MPKGTVTFVGLEHIERDTGVRIGSEQVKLQEMTGRRARFFAGDIVYGYLRPYLNKVWIAEFDGICSVDQYVFKTRSNAERNYVAHYLRSQTFLRTAPVDTTPGQLPRIRSGEIASTKIPLPPLDEQKRIAAILDQADTIRRLRQRTIDRLNELGQAIFYEMFGDPATNPKGWRSGVLSDVVRDGDRINCGVVQPGDDVDGGVPLIRVADLLTPDIAISTVKHISREIEAAYSRSRLSGDEILVGCVGSIGAVALATPRMRGANIARAVGRVPVAPEKANRVYLAEFLKNPVTQRYFTAETRTVAQPTLNIKQLAEAPVLLPPKECQDEFERAIGALEAAWVNSRTQLNTLGKLFSSLQHRAFTNQL